MSTFKLRSSYGALALGVASLACGGDEKLGSVMLAISTDLYIDKDVSRVDIIVQPEHGPTQQTQFNLAPGLDGQYLPGTFAIIEGSTPGEFLRVRIVARQGSFARVVREAALRVPRQRTALLSMPIQWLCDGHVRQEGQVTRSNCDEGETCSKGACAPDAVDETTLPDYEAAAVFGGGDPTGGGECFDTVPCFEINSEPALDLDTCVLDTEVSDDLNIGIRLPVGSAGHCSNAECWVPLDASAQSGWEPIEGGGRVQLPPAVCGHVRDEGASVRVSHECASKACRDPDLWPLDVGRRGARRRRQHRRRAPDGHHPDPGDRAPDRRGPPRAPRRERLRQHHPGERPDRAHPRAGDAALRARPAAPSPPRPRSIGTTSRPSVGPTTPGSSPANAPATRAASPAPSWIAASRRWWPASATKRATPASAWVPRPSPSTAPAPATARAAARAAASASGNATASATR